MDIARTLLPDSIALRLEQQQQSTHSPAPRGMLVAYTTLLPWSSVSRPPARHNTFIFGRNAPSHVFPSLSVHESLSPCPHPHSVIKISPAGVKPLIRSET